MGESLGGSIYVIAGVNGGGKSSVLGEALRARPGGAYLNPDQVAAELRADNRV